MNTATRALHELTHRVPGVPEHSDAANAQSRQASKRAHGWRHHGTSLHSPNRHHTNPPRILIAWQNRIARLLHADR